MTDMTLADQLAPNSHLFTLRIWPEDLGGGQIAWRGSVQHANSGEARYFRDWPTLEAFILERLATDLQGKDNDRVATVLSNLVSAFDEAAGTGLWTSGQLLRSCPLAHSPYYDD